MSATTSIQTPLADPDGHASLNYGIAITAGILILISTILISSYTCKWINRRTHIESPHAHNSTGVQPESNENVVIRGLEGPIIESYPKFVYGGDAYMSCGPHDSMCSICLSDYKPDEMLRCIPECKHCFHVGCIDKWLQMRATCPVCRNSPVPTPLATPLSELIPLAIHAR